MTTPITIIDHHGKPSVTSLQVAEHFGKRHDNVLRDIDEIVAQVSETFGKLNFECAENATKNNLGFDVRNRMYLLSKDGFTMLTMGYTGAKAMAFKEKYIAAFNAMEESIRNQAASAIPNFADPVAAARAWADKEEQRRVQESARLALEQKMEEVKPKVVFAEAIEVAKDAVLVAEMAKLIKQATGYDMGQNRFFDFLRDGGYLHKHGSQRNLPTQRSIDAGWMVIKEGTRSGTGGEMRITKTPKITGRGQVYFINLFKSKTNALAVCA